MTLSGEVGFANFPEQGRPAGQGPLDRFVLRGLIFFYCNGGFADAAPKTVHLTLASQDCIAGAGVGCLVLEVREAHFQNQAPHPGPRGIDKGEA